MNRDRQSSKKLREKIMREIRAEEICPSTCKGIRKIPTIRDPVTGKPFPRPDRYK
jgi:hypothetical protein